MQCTAKVIQNLKNHNVKLIIDRDTFLTSIILMLCASNASAVSQAALYAQLKIYAFLKLTPIAINSG